MMSHPSKRELQLYQEGFLVGPRQMMITGHLEGCPECQAYLDALSPFGGPETGDVVPGAEPAGPESVADGRSSPETPAGPADPPPDFPGILPRTLGEYELLEALRAGGMGEVYRARHRLLGKLVAVKLLPAGRQGSAHAVARFQREMQAVGQLDHPNLVEAHDAGECDGIFYLVLKLIEGTNLHDLVRKRGP